jgi:phosphatidylglycerophosphatase A
VGREAAVAVGRMSTDPTTLSSASQTKVGTRVWILVATFFGAGYLKPGPGTWASMAAVLLWGAAAWGLHPHSAILFAILLIGIALAIGFGVPAATIAERETGQHDPGFVVIDEVAGQWIALLGCPGDWAHGLITLILFRIFDITKPFPIRRMERLPAGWGIVFDDVAAGLYALVVSTVVRIWF